MHRFVHICQVRERGLPQGVALVARPVIRPVSEAVVVNAFTKFRKGLPCFLFAYQVKSTFTPAELWDAEKYAVYKMMEVVVDRCSLKGRRSVSICAT